MKILVVEDHPDQLKLANHVLSAAGHEVEDATAAEQAFAAVSRVRPEVILLDLSLPDMDGLAFARRLKADPATNGIPIVAVTSFPEWYSRHAALAAGCAEFLLKPFSTRTLPDVMVDAGRKHKSSPP